MRKTLKVFVALFLLVILVGCNGGSKEKSKLPDLTNRSKKQITSIFQGITEKITFEFEFEYSNTIAEDFFIRYKEPAKVGDEINDGDKIVIVLADKKLYLPNLTGKNKAEIEESFGDIKAKLGDEAVKLNYKYAYPTFDQENIFVSYLNDLNEGDVVLKNSEIDILINGYYALYPEIQNKTTTEVEALFNELFQSYDYIDYQIVYEDFYDTTIEEGTVISYVIDVEPGDPIKDLENLIIRKSFQTLVLPNLRGFKLHQIKDLFARMNISADRLEFRVEYDQYVSAGEFIKYDGGYKAGDVFDIVNSKLIIYYDIRPVLKDLEGYNKHQIEQEFSNTDVNLSFEYILNNDLEYDTFAGYKNHQIGDEIVSQMELTILLYKNDDVNVLDEINVEQQLMISKYISGMGNNLGIEIYNPTDEDIVLDNYYIAIIPSRQYVLNNSIQLTGIIPSKGVYVVVNIDAEEALRNISHMQTSLMTFGANSTIQLRRSGNNTYIDTVYSLGNISTSFDREIFVRKGHLTHGRRDFVYVEWKSYVPDYLDVIGTHPNDGPEDPVFELIADKTFQEYGMTKVKYLSAADGDTVYLESLDPRDETIYSGNSRVRFLIVDTPETEKPGQVGEPYAQVATNFTKNMLSSATEIYLQASVEGGIKDTYGRHLGLIWANIGTAANPNWRLLNYELLKAGLGQIGIAKTGNYYNHPIFSNRYLYQWAQEADHYAMVNKLGLYSGVHQD